MQASYTIGPFLLPLGIKDRPFRAEFKQDRIEKISDSKISKQSRAGQIYRAFDGRTRIEEYRNDKEGKNLITAIIYNPSKLEGYLLDIENKAFFTVPLSSSDSESSLPIFEGNDIGKKVIENLVCRGYQKKRGDDDIFQYWVSEELLEALIAKSVSGNETNILRLFNIKRLEPNRKMFVVPKDYTPIKIE